MILLPFIGFTVKTIGEVLLGFSVYFVHQRVAKEKKIDFHILTAFHREKMLALIAIFLIVVGYILEVLKMFDQG